MPCMETFIASNSSSGLTSDTHVSASPPLWKQAIPTWQILDKSAFAVSTSIATKSIHHPRLEQPSLTSDEHWARCEKHSKRGIPQRDSAILTYPKQAPYS